MDRRRTFSDPAQLWALDLADDRCALDYARYFTYCVSDIPRVFRIVSSTSPLRWQPDASERQREEVGGLLQPTLVVARDASGLIMISATMLYGPALFSVDLVIAPQALEAKLQGVAEPRTMWGGEVVMLNDQVLADDLPMRVAPPHGAGT